MIIRTPEHTEYVFSAENKYSVVPETWADLYFILSFDRNSFEGSKRNFVFSKDPASKTNERRVYVEQTFEPVEPTEDEQKAEQERLDAIDLEKFKLQYISAINHKVAIGAIDRLPDEDEIVEEAIKYANEKLADLRKQRETVVVQDEEPKGDSVEFNREEALARLEVLGVNVQKNIGNEKLKIRLAEAEAEAKEKEEADKKVTTDETNTGDVTTGDTSGTDTSVGTDLEPK